MASSLAPESIDFSRFDWIDFAFAFPDASYNITWDDPIQTPDLLRRLVAAAHGAGKKVKLSIGGWTGSQYMSGALSTHGSRQTFTSNILSTYTDFSLDGIDIVWQYPGQRAAASTSASPSDSANLLLFFQYLRGSLPASARITAAGQTTTWVDNQGKPMVDLSDYAKILDWVTLMNYDTVSKSFNVPTFIFDRI